MQYAGICGAFWFIMNRAQLCCSNSSQPGSRRNGHLVPIKSGPPRTPISLFVGALAMLVSLRPVAAETPDANSLEKLYQSEIRPLVEQFCHKCHSGELIEAEIDLNTAGEGLFLSARFSVRLPGIDREIARSLIDEAHKTCPYSKATRDNIKVAIRLVE